jgi:hypothetical protein
LMLATVATPDGRNVRFRSQIRLVKLGALLGFSFQGFFVSNNFFGKNWQIKPN